MRKLVKVFEDKISLWPGIVDTATLKRQAGLALKRPGLCQANKMQLLSLRCPF